MTYPPEQLKAMEALYAEVMDSDVTIHALDFLCRVQLLLDITGDDTAAAKAVVHADAGRLAAKREFDGLGVDDRRELVRSVGQHWSLNVSLAVRKLWHAASVLGFQPDTLDAKYVALVAATYLSRSPRDVLDEIARSGGDDPDDMQEGSRTGARE